VINEESMDSTTRKVLDHMARLDFNIEAKAGSTTLISFHHSYNDYLDS
jgi:hypothetical protein